MYNVNQISRLEGLDSNSKRVHINNNPFKLKLKAHQETLLYRVLEVDNNFSNSQMPFGLLSDKPGAGKTFVVLAMIYYSINFFNSQGINVIVVPHNIYNQWINAIKIFLGDLLHYICLVDYKEVNKLFLNTEILYKYHIIITTPLMYDVFASTLNNLNIVVRRVFFDEADSVKNILVNSIKSQMTWFISASIHSVFDSNTLTASIGSYKNLYLPNLLLNECFCKDEYIDAHIKLPKPECEEFICKDFYIDILLSNVLEKDMLKLIYAHDYLEIRQECDGHTVKENKDILKYIYLYSSKMIFDCDAILKELAKNKIDAQDVKGKTNKRRAFYYNRLGLIKTVCSKYYVCIQCYNHIKSKAYKSECNDLLCHECYQSITKCLTCNKIHQIDTYIKNDKNDEDEDFNNKIQEFIDKTPLNKFVILDKILEVTGNKVLIYSEFRGLNNHLKTYSIKNKIGYEELNGGNIKEIDRILDEFKNNPDTKIMLIDNAYFGVGLNIEYATDIIFFHNTEINKEKQLIGRAQRFGRKSKLNIWKLKYFTE
jgi:SNF2 family DNA or RNA helicase